MLISQWDLLGTKYKLRLSCQYKAQKYFPIKDVEVSSKTRKLQDIHVQDIHVHVLDNSFLLKLTHNLDNILDAMYIVLLNLARIVNPRNIR
jgi:hypothetical protein